MLNLKNHVPARLPVGHPPVLTVIVDTEEEFDWSLPFSRASIQTTSIAAQPLAHEAVFDASRSGTNLCARLAGLQ